MTDTEPPSRRSDAARPSPSDVTIVVCSRNRAEMLAGALARIAETAPSGVRVLVVDSASESGATAEAAAAAGVDLVRTDVRGLSIARNIGLARADRAIVVYTDDDCRPAPGWIEHLLPPFEDDAVGAVTGRLVDHAGGAPAPDEPASRLTRTVDGLDAGHGALMAFRRELLDRLGGFDEVLGAGRRFAGAEDLDMFCRILASGSAIVREPRSMILHVHTREDREYTELLHGYGLGLGGLVTKWLRMSPAVGARLAVLALGRTVVRLVHGLGSRRRRRGQFAMLRGTVTGMVRSARFPIAAARFVDTDPPPPTPLADAGGRLAGDPR